MQFADGTNERIGEQRAKRRIQHYSVCVCFELNVRMMHGWHGWHGWKLPGEMRPCNFVFESRHHQRDRTRARERKFNWWRWECHTSQVATAICFNKWIFFGQSSYLFIHSFIHSSDFGRSTLCVLARSSRFTYSFCVCLFHRVCRSYRFRFDIWCAQWLRMWPIESIITHIITSSFTTRRTTINQHTTEHIHAARRCCIWCQWEKCVCCASHYGYSMDGKSPNENNEVRRLSLVHSPHIRIPSETVLIFMCLPIELRVCERGVCVVSLFLHTWTEAYHIPSFSSPI